MGGEEKKGDGEWKITYWIGPEPMRILDIVTEWQFVPEAKTLKARTKDGRTIFMSFGNEVFRIDFVPIGIAG